MADKFVGTWALETSENFDEYMKAVGRLLIMCLNDKNKNSIYGSLLFVLDVSSPLLSRWITHVLLTGGAVGVLAVGSYGRTFGDTKYFMFTNWVQKCSVSMIIPYQLAYDYQL